MSVATNERHGYGVVMQTLWQDLRHGVRTLRKKPGDVRQRVHFPEYSCVADDSGPFATSNESRSTGDAEVRLAPSSVCNYE